MPFDFNSILAEPRTLPDPDTLHHDFLSTVMYAQRAERLSRVLEQYSHGADPVLSGHLSRLSHAARDFARAADNALASLSSDTLATIKAR